MTTATEEPTVVDATVVDETPELVRPEPHETALAIRSTGSTELIHAATGTEKVAIATEYATALDAVIRAQGMRTKVGKAKVVAADGRESWVDKYHVNVEGWQTLATFLGLAVVPCWSRRVIDPETGKAERVRYTVTKQIYGKGTRNVVATETSEIDGYSWESRVEVFKDGALLAAGEAMCSRTEQTWRDRDDFALRGMAQTRATSRAIAGAARWIVALAGYSATPAEEFGAHEAPTGPPAEAGPAYGPPATRDQKLAAIDALIRLLGVEKTTAIEVAKVIALGAGYMPAVVAEAFGVAAGARLSPEPEPDPPPAPAVSSEPVTPPDAVRTLSKLAKGQLDRDVRGAAVLCGIDFPSGATGDARFRALTEQQVDALMGALTD